MAEIALRRWRRADLADVLEIADDPWIGPWSLLRRDPQAWIERELAQTHGITRAVCLAGEDRAVGRVSLRGPGQVSEAVRSAPVRETERPVGEVGYWVLPGARGRGIAAEAVRALLTLPGAVAGLRAVVLDIEVANHASVRVAERLGAEPREPTRVEHDRDGRPHELKVHVLTL